MNKKIRLLVLTIALAAGMAIGMFITPTIASSKFNIGQDKVPNFPVNANGQTYGSSLEAVSVETEPDLIAAIGIDGTEGYVLSKDLQEPSPKTPEEAVAQTKEIEKAALAAKAKGSNIVREIPLYDVDGRTVIGKFGIVAPDTNKDILKLK